MLKKLTVAVLACVTLFLAKRAHPVAHPHERRPVAEHARGASIDAAKRPPSAVALF